jgi:hypothetical protein
VYNDDIPKLIGDIKDDAIKLSGYILMDKIEPPNNVHNILVRNGEAQQVAVVSELGVYGVWLR